MMEDKVRKIDQKRIDVYITAEDFEGLKTFILEHLLKV